MSFHLRASRPIGRELRHLVRREFRLAIERLSAARPDETSIHEVRKSLKRIRAVVRLLQREPGSHYALENGLLRRAAHRLAALRDAEVAAETLAALAARYPSQLARSTTRTALRTLRARARRVERRSSGGLTRARRELERARTSVLNDLHHVGGFAAARAGVTSGYRRARRAMTDLSEDTSAVRFHRWRRRVKVHWFHVRLFETVSDRARARGARLGRLEAALGDDHNLSMLRAAIMKTPQQFGDASWRSDVLSCVAKGEAALRRRALKLGASLFADRPKSFQDEVTRWRR